MGLVFSMYLATLPVIGLGLGVLPAFAFFVLKILSPFSAFDFQVLAPWFLALSIFSPLASFAFQVFPPWFLVLLELPPPCIRVSICFPDSPSERHLRLLNRDMVVKGKQIKA